MEIEVTQRAAEMLIDKFALVIKAIDMFEKIEVSMDTCHVHRLINAFPNALLRADCAHGCEREQLDLQRTKLDADYGAGGRGAASSIQHQHVAEY